MSEALAREVHTLLISVGGGLVLLPNAVVAEIAPLAALEKIGGAPSWLLGRMPWRERPIPVFSFPMLTGASVQEDTRQARVAVLKTLDDRDGAMPHIGLIVQGLPRLTTITPDLLVRTDGGAQPSAGTSAQVLLRSDQAIVPDLPWIEDRVAQALGA